MTPDSAHKLTSMSHRWRLIRLVFVAFWLLAGATGDFQAIPLSASSLIATGIAFVFGMFLTRFHIFRVYQSKQPDEIWLLPCWKLNPFQSGQPFQFIHMAAISFVLFGAVASARTLILSQTSIALPGPLLLGVFGGGAWFGIYLAILSHRQRFRP